MIYLYRAVKTFAIVFFVLCLLTFIFTGDFIFLIPTTLCAIASVMLAWHRPEE